jgi:uncharacterized protein YdhG (YjbR/CyaY superfamily)
VLELGGRTAVGLAEGGAEMAVAGEAEVEAQRCEVMVLRKQMERAGKAQSQLIAIERHAFDLLKHLSEVDGRAANLGGDLGQGPAARRVACKHELDAIDQTAPSRASGGRMRCARPQCALRQGQGQAFGFKELGHIASQAVTEQGYEGLGAGIDAQPLRVKCGCRARREQRGGREFEEQFLADGQGEAGIAAANRMADAVALAGIEEQHLVGFGYGLIGAEMTDIGAAIGKDDLGGGGVFFRALLAAAAGAVDVADGDRGGLEQQLRRDIEVVGELVCWRHGKNLRGVGRIHRNAREREPDRAPGGRVIRYNRHGRMEDGMARKSGASGVDEYIAGCPKEAREGLAKMRAAIRAAAPGARERTDYFEMPGYSYPGYDYDGMFVWFSYKNPSIRLHVRPPVIEEHSQELADYPTTKAIVSFSVNEKLPLTLVKKLVKASLKVMKEKNR